MKTNSTTAKQKRTATPPTEPTPRASARERLLAAAKELFYEEGVQSVGIERIIERAGVAKASLYANFKSKDDLVRAYLAERGDTRRARIQAKMAQFSTPQDKLLAIFDALTEAFAQPNYRGCAFVRASAEMRADSSARTVCEDMRTRLHQLFTDLARQAGAQHPKLLARQLILLYDGASVAAQMDGDLGAAKAARATAAQLLDAAI